MITQVNVKIASQMRKVLEEQLGLIAKQLNMDVSIGKITYSDTSMQMGLTFALKADIIGNSGTPGFSNPLPASHKWVMAWNRYKDEYDLTDGMLGFVIQSPMGFGQVCGFTRHGKLPIIIALMDDRGALTGRYTYVASSYLRVEYNARQKQAIAAN